ncbi:hypothetical protein [Halobacillus sp. A5]|uniref:hypothetical protein n=1 Tax=Halobacillus sp. A5 TaxID=2880263 RepID=UPI0020A6C7D7|nr:hypothetical protein [Halobacillus sp. A5]MCP3026458.1 hypothetical protein [Halobacillus sp. A5]
MSKRKGIFFQDKRYKSSKPVNLVRVVFALTAGLLLLYGIKQEFEGIIGYVFGIAGAGSFIDAAESYVHREEKTVYLAELGFALVWICAFILWLI